MADFEPLLTLNISACAGSLPAKPITNKGHNHLSALSTDIYVVCHSGLHSPTSKLLPILAFSILYSGPESGHGCHTGVFLLFIAANSSYSPIDYG